MFGVVVECALLWVVSEKLLCLPRLCFRAPIDTHLNLGFVREAQRAHPTYPDQEIFDHLLFGVRFKSKPSYQMILQPHL